VAKVLGDAYAQLLQMRASVTYTVGVFATVRDAERRILLVEQSYAGRHWAQPGGGLEDGENPIDGVDIGRDRLYRRGYRLSRDLCVGIQVRHCASFRGPHCA
jgi:8-oxo-dGTP pyrophosphatase MutT (NUDIX family)